ncbi:MAG: hypothetical protein P1V51_23300 [Deltaproteobacteria bacterium]|nr:hypothetical protein [Deltaproteobacteria bacterium]
MLALALLGASQPVHAAGPGEDPLAVADTYLAAGMHEDAEKAYLKAKLLDEELDLALLARAENFERWGRLQESVRSYRRFLSRSEELLPRLVIERIEQRARWLSWNDAHHRSKVLLRKGATRLIGGIALGGLGTLAYLGGRSLMERSNLDLNLIIGALVLEALGWTGFGLGGLLGTVGLANLVWGGVLASRGSQEPPRPGALGPAPAWRRMVGSRLGDPVPSGSAVAEPETSPRLTPPPLVRVPATPLAPPPLPPPPVLIVPR